MLVVLVAALSITTVASGAPPPPRPDRKAPTAPRRIAVMSATPTAVTAAWAPSTDNVGVAGYGVYLGGTWVQGETAPLELCAALERVCRWGGAELVIIGRGGGSRDDLWAFTHALLHDVAYETLPFAMRTLLHHSTVPRFST